ncbi:hypothetical protein [Clostridium sp.]|nr:hypothetical protein [uncultured Clostridium sp.]
MNIQVRFLSKSGNTKKVAEVISKEWLYLVQQQSQNPLMEK